MPLEPCEKRAARVSSTALVRYRCNDYSVPTAYGFRDVLVKGFVDEVVILCGGEEIARHRRAYGTGTFVFDPLHYLALIETKPNALDQAAPLQGWDLPEVFQHLRHLLEARMGNRGKREFIQVLRLMEAIPMEIVAAAVTEAIRLGAIGFDAVKQIALARVERRPARLDLTAYPHLPKMDVQDHGGGRLRRSRSRERCMTGTAGVDAMPTGTTSGTPQVLLAHHLKQLKLPTVLREYDKVARECARDGVDHPRYLLRLVELELIDRERRMVERRIKAARFPAVKSLDTFDFTAIPSLNKMLVLELARCEFILRRENVIALGNSGTGKTHVALALGLAACQKGFTRRLHHRGRPRPSAHGGARRTTPAEAAARSPGGEAPDRRRTRLRATVADRRRTAVRGLLPALRARLDHRHIQSAVRGLDIGAGIGTAHRRAARPADPPRPHPDDERRQLPAQAIRRTASRRAAVERAEQNQATTETVDPETGEISDP